MSSLQERAVGAACRYLELQDYAVLETGYTVDDIVCDIVAREYEGGPLHFITVNAVGDVDAFTELAPRMTRGDFEHLAASYLREHQKDANYPVMSSAASLLVVGPDRALLRFEINRGTEL